MNEQDARRINAVAEAINPDNAKDWLQTIYNLGHAAGRIDGFAQAQAIIQDNTQAATESRDKAAK